MRIATSRLLLIAILAVVALLALGSAALFQAPELVGKERVLTDFDAFYIAGTMAGQGQAAETYQAAETFAAQRGMTGRPSFMPWTYPPPYTLAMEGLARLPIGPSYLLFITATLAFYLLVLQRIAGVYLPGVLVAILPTILLTVKTGQNGFLTGGLIGCFLLAFIDRRAVAGVPLGLMIMKPHLAAGITLLALLGRSWNAMAIAAGVVIAALLTATVAFGTGVWAAFLGGLREAGGFLAEGYYQLFRMTSIYASARSLGGSSSLALALHAIGALVAIAFLLQVWRMGCKPRILAAAACVSSLFVSPYSYDYDLPILGLAIAFVLPDIIERCGKWQLLGLLLLSWFATGYGLALVLLFGDPDTGLQSGGWWSLAAPALILLVATGCVVLHRGETSSAIAGPRHLLERGT